MRCCTGHGRQSAICNCYYRHKNGTRWRFELCFFSCLLLLLHFNGADYVASSGKSNKIVSKSIVRAMCFVDSFFLFSLKMEWSTHKVEHATRIVETRLVALTVSGHLLPRRIVGFVDRLPDAITEQYTRIRWLAGDNCDLEREFVKLHVSQCWPNGWHVNVSHFRIGTETGWKSAAIQTEGTTNVPCPPIAHWQWAFVPLPPVQLTMQMLAFLFRWYYWHDYFNKYPVKLP